MNREAMINEARSRGRFDVIVIGGGATGCGIAVDAANRGLSVALVEMNDFSEGTSSRSTKLLHGGVRYLEIAVKHASKAQFTLVKDGLAERATVIRNSPHLSRKLTLVTPLYRLIDIPYMYAGLTLYDLIAGKNGIGKSAYVTPKKLARMAPMVNTNKLKGGVRYADGQFEDMRLTVSLARTAADEGALCLNHVKAVGFVKNGGRITGVTVTDTLTEETFDLAAPMIFNAGGPFADAVRSLEGDIEEPMLELSSGIHVVLPAKYSTGDVGLLIPETEDGRVLFALPWQGRTLLGTTDESAALDEHPAVSDDDVTYLLRNVEQWFDEKIDRSEILASWSGLRPLVRDTSASDTANLVRDHVVSESESGLITVTGGKWTTYRLMAEHALDYALAERNMTAKPCATSTLMLRGGKNYTPALADELAASCGIPPHIARHLARSYGSDAADVCPDGDAALLADNFPFIEAEVRYAARHESARSVMDVLVRRIPLALLDTNAAENAVDRVAAVMGSELGWEQAAVDAAAADARHRLATGI